MNILSNNLSLNNYSKITNIFDDYNHIYKCHDPNEIFCFLTNNNKCEIEKCNYFNRIKTNFSYNCNRNDISLRQLLDEIHWNFIHFHLYYNYSNTKQHE